MLQMGCIYLQEAHHYSVTHCLGVCPLSYVSLSAISHVLSGH